MAEKTVTYDPTKEQRTNDSERVFHTSNNTFLRLKEGENIVDVDEWAKVVEYSFDVIDMLVANKALDIEPDPVVPEPDPVVPEPDPVVNPEPTSTRQTTRKPPTTLT